MKHTVSPQHPHRRAVLEVGPVATTIALSPVDDVKCVSTDDVLGTKSLTDTAHLTIIIIIIIITFTSAGA